MFRYHRTLAALALLLAIVLEDASRVAAEDAFDPSSVDAAGLLARYCFECHGPEVQEANLRFDALDLQNPKGGASETLQKVIRVVRQQEMPPEGAEYPTSQQRAALVAWAEQQLRQLDEQAEHQGQWARNRRLTVEEYNFTMQALFGVDAGFADFLPADPISESGYRNSNERLGLSSLQVESYLDSARRAVDRYVHFGANDQQPIRYFIELKDLYYSTAERYESRKRAPQPLDAESFTKRRAANRSSPPEYVDPIGPTPPGAFSDDEQWRAAIPKLHQQYLAIPKRLTTGELIIRIRAAGSADRDGRFPRLRVEAGITLGDGCSIDKRIVGETDVTAPVDEPQVYEFRIRLEDVPTKGPLREDETFDRLSVFDMDQIFLSNISCDERAIFGLGRGAYSTPEEGSAAIAPDLAQMTEDGVNLLHLDSVEIEMLPGVGAENRSYRWTVRDPETGENGGLPSAIVSDLLARFMEAAYRRPVSEEELETKLKLFRQLRSQQYAFEESLRETLAAVLVSPSFLFVESPAPEQLSRAPGGQLTPYQTAARLSYLLWLSPPDDALMKRAADGTLEDRDVIRHEIRRLLADPRSRRFLESFCRQWLRLDRHANVAVDRAIYPAFDDDFAAVSVRETLEFFVHAVRTGGSALDLIDCEYAILNDRLARHYGVDGVTSGELQKVRLPDDSVRGGLLTQASLLTTNSDGVDSHPIRRGVWLLDRILNDPPPPPPPQVPELDDEDPNLRGLSLKERIERHREPSACQNCHQKIDPWGIALENFDAIGRWRDKIVTDTDDSGRPQPVESATMLPSGEPVDGVSDLKRHLIERRSEQFADAFVHHLLTYMLGRPPRYSERAHVEKIQAQFAEAGYRIDELVVALIDSELILPQTSTTVSQSLQVQ